MLFVPVFLKEAVQGYWYTFGSIAALTTFADLGFATIMTQYAAHEFTYLKLKDNPCVFEGDKDKLERMSSLFQFVVKWVSFVLILAFSIILIVGICMFLKQNDGVDWVMPWVLFALGTVLNFGTEVILSFFEGCNQFHITQKIRVIAGTLHCIFTIILLFCGAELYALAIPIFIKATIVALGVIKNYGIAIKQMIKTKSEVYINWFKEIIPLLIRYAVSWISGYFAQQIYSPLAFSNFGAASAGLVGYSLSIISAIYSVANVWNILAVPQYNMEVEKKEWKQMDLLLKRNLILSLSTYTLGILALFIVSFIPFFKHLIWAHLLSPYAIAMLAVNYFLSIIIYVLATYLRAHKEEPYMIVSVCSGSIGTVLTFVITHFLGVQFMFLGLLLANVISLPMSIYIWKMCKKKWHSEIG